MLRGELHQSTNTFLVAISTGGRGDVVYSRSGCGSGGFIDPNASQLIILVPQWDGDGSDLRLVDGAHPKKRSMIGVPPAIVR